MFGGGGTCKMVPCLTSRRGVFGGGGTCKMVPCLTSRRGCLVGVEHV